MQPYTDEFYGDISPGSSISAARVLPLIIEEYQVSSIVDVGCGSGVWLSQAISLGVDKVLGIDGSWALGPSQRLKHTQFVECDLTMNMPDISQRFDLAISLEVAEHLPADRADDFVALLCSLADLVMFSAAIPKQGGLNHVNEQWQSYWISLFETRGFAVRDIIRPKIWSDNEVEVWYRQNILVFVKNGVKEIVYDDLVHPHLFHVTTIGSSQTRVQRLKSLPSGIVRRLKRILKVDW